MGAWTYVCVFVFAIGSCLLRMANTLLTHFTHVVKHRSHPIIDEIQEITGSLTQEIFAWLVYGMGATVLHAIRCSKHMVEEIILYLVHVTFMLLVMTTSNTGSHRNCLRLRN